METGAEKSPIDLSPGVGSESQIVKIARKARTIMAFILKRDELYASVTIRKRIKKAYIVAPIKRI